MGEDAVAANSVLLIASVKRQMPGPAISLKIAQFDHFCSRSPSPTADLNTDVCQMNGRISGDSSGLDESGFLIACSGPSPQSEADTSQTGQLAKLPSLPAEERNDGVDREVRLVRKTVQRLEDSRIKTEALGNASPTTFGDASGRKPGSSAAAVRDRFSRVARH